MHILVLAPHPFYQERGTPIAVKLLLEALSARGHSMDVATFNEGADVHIPGVRIHRTPALPGLTGIRPGFSFKKLISDFFLFWIALGLVIRRRPQVIHSVEEACFMGLVFRMLFRIPYVYDMDSSMPDQIVEKVPGLRFLRPLMHRLVGCAAGAALLVTPVCEALAETAESYRPRKTILLRDVSLLKRASGLRAHERGLPTPGTRFLYVGNLESYQGIDLMLAAFAQHVARRPADRLVVAGGPDALVTHYRNRCAAFRVGAKVTFLGPQPVDRMAELFEAADVLVSPRIKGTNTPMKIYSYLDSGRPTLATRLPTHTQAMDDATALLAEPTPEAFAAGMTRLSDDPELRHTLAARALRLVETRYSRAAFDQAVGELCNYLAAQLKSPADHESKPGRPGPAVV